jgi:MFS family permease
MERKANRSMWDPLSEPLFRWLWIAALASNIGSWMHDVAAAWLMTSLSDSPVMISLMQTASFLPFFVLALPAGAFADIFNRRSVLIFGQAWMLISALAIGLCSMMGVMNPWLLLSLTLMLGIGGAISSPAWNAALPELVSKKNLESAIALGGMGWNIARGVGSAIGGFLVALSGPGAVFVLNALSFLAVLWVFWTWKRPKSAENSQNETVVGAIRAGVRFVRHSHSLVGILWRTMVFVSCSTAFWALLPLFCRVHLKVNATEYGILLSAFGIGALAGAGLMPRLRKNMSLDACTAAGTVLFAVGMLGLALSPHYYVGLLMTFIAGLAWIQVTSSLNMGAQLACPAWVRSRALSVYILVWHGTMAIASLAWGTFAKFFNMENALLVAACGLLVSLLMLPRRHKLGDLEKVDMTASGHWKDPVLALTPRPEHGPVQITVEYTIDPDTSNEFVEAMTQLAVQRKRDGAFQWHLMCDLGEPTKYVETYFVETWAEHERQHRRVTIADKPAEERVAALHVGDSRPIVRHLISGIGLTGELTAPKLHGTELMPGTEPGEPPCGVCTESDSNVDFEPSSDTAEVEAWGSTPEEMVPDTGVTVPAAFSAVTEVKTSGSSPKPAAELVKPTAIGKTGELQKPDFVGESPNRNSLEYMLDDMSASEETPTTPLQTVSPAGQTSQPGTGGAPPAAPTAKAATDGDSLEDFLSDLGSSALPVSNGSSSANNKAPAAARDGDSLADFLSDLKVHGKQLSDPDLAVPGEPLVDIDALFKQDPGDTLTKIRPLRSPEWVDTFDGIERPNPRDGNVVDIDSLFSKRPVYDDLDSASEEGESAHDKPAQSLFDLFDSFEASAGSRLDQQPKQSKPLVDLSPPPEDQEDIDQRIKSLDLNPQDTLTTGGDSKSNEENFQEEIPADTLVDIEAYTRHPASESLTQVPVDTLVDIEAHALRNPDEFLTEDTGASTEIPADTLVDIEAYKQRNNQSDRLTVAPTHALIASSLEDIEEARTEDPSDTLVDIVAYSRQHPRERLMRSLDALDELDQKAKEEDFEKETGNGKEKEKEKGSRNTLTGIKLLSSRESSEDLTAVTGDDEPVVSTGEREAGDIEPEKTLTSPSSQLNTGEMEALDLPFSESLTGSTAEAGSSPRPAGASEVTTGEREAVDFKPADKLSPESVPSGTGTTKKVEPPIRKPPERPLLITQNREAPSPSPPPTSSGSAPSAPTSSDTRPSLASPRPSLSSASSTSSQPPSQPPSATPDSASISGSDNKPSTSVPGPSLSDSRPSTSIIKPTTSGLKPSPSDSRPWSDSAKSLSGSSPPAPGETKPTTSGFKPSLSASKPFLPETKTASTTEPKPSSAPSAAPSSADSKPTSSIGDSIPSSSSTKPSLSDLRSSSDAKASAASSADSAVTPATPVNKPSSFMSAFTGYREEDVEDGDESWEDDADAPQNKLQGKLQDKSQQHKPGNGASDSKLPTPSAETRASWIAERKSATDVNPQETLGDVTTIENAAFTPLTDDELLHEGLLSDNGASGDSKNTDKKPSTDDR